MVFVRSIDISGVYFRCREWDFMIIRVSSTRKLELVKRVQVLESEGWEAVHPITEISEFQHGSHNKGGYKTKSTLTKYYVKMRRAEDGISK